MTLQQKVLSKKSKKGFTLVELVVVIAILAILAAIAIPAVVGIIDNAQKSAKSSNAAQLDSACKTFYSGVTSGSIHQGSSNTGTISKSKLPSATATVSTKKSTADGLTVQDAIDYSGLSSKFAAEQPADYGFTADGTIVFVGDTSVSNTAFTAFSAKTLGGTNGLYK